MLPSTTPEQARQSLSQTKMLLGLAEDQPLNYAVVARVYRGMPLVAAKIWEQIQEAQAIAAREVSQ